MTHHELLACAQHISDTPIDASQGCVPLWRGVSRVATINGKIVDGPTAGEHFRKEGAYEKAVVNGIICSIGLST